MAAQSPSVIALDASTYYFAWAARGQPPALYEFSGGSAATELTPVTTLAGELTSGPDLSWQSPSVLMAAFDSMGMLAIYPLSSSSAGTTWRDPLRLYSPSQSFTFSPALCAERGTSGSFSINVAAVSGHDLWFAATPRISTGPTQFSSWTMISSDAASAPDCAILRENPNLAAIIHVVTVSGRGAIIDVQGNGTTWATTDLGFPP